MQSFFRMDLTLIYYGLFFKCVLIRLQSCRLHAQGPGYAETTNVVRLNRNYNIFYVVKNGCRFNGRLVPLLQHVKN